MCGGDHQCELDTIQIQEWANMMEGTVMAPDSFTCNPDNEKAAPIDFFVVSNTIAPFVEAVSTIDVNASPHKPVRMEIGRVPTDLHEYAAVKPKPVPNEIPQGPLAGEGYNWILYERKWKLGSTETDMDGMARDLMEGIQHELIQKYLVEHEQVNGEFPYNGRGKGLVVKKIKLMPKQTKNERMASPPSQHTKKLAKIWEAVARWCMGRVEMMTLMQRW